MASQWDDFSGLNACLPKTLRFSRTLARGEFMSSCFSSRFNQVIEVCVSNNRRNIPNRSLWQPDILCSAHTNMFDNWKHPLIPSVNLCQHRNHRRDALNLWSLNSSLREERIVYLNIRHNAHLGAATLVSPFDLLNIFHNYFKWT